MSYNSELDANNTELQEILNAVNNLPEAGSNAGENGATFTPDVSDDGVLSWTNDKALPNPDPVNIKGDKGDKGDTGVAGADGKDGVSATHSWNGTTLTITSASGTSSADLKGDKGADGADGKDGKDGKDGRTPVKGTDFWTPGDKEEIKQELETDLSKTYGMIFAEFPSEDAIKVLPNNSFFTVVSHGRANTDGQMATYYRTTSWTRNALKYTDVDGTTTIYVVPINQAVGEVYLPFYGIKTGEDNAESNSAIMATLLENLEFGSTLKMPVGHFYFSDPINLETKQASLIGETCLFSSYHVGDKGTFLHFHNLTEGQSAITAGTATLRNFKVIGSSDAYTVVTNRENAKTDPSTTIVETAKIKAYAIQINGPVVADNVGASNFYYGLNSVGGNHFFTNLRFDKCHYGCIISNDTKLNTIHGVDVMTLLRITGGLTGAYGLRGDSIGNHMVEIMGGFSAALYEIDGDFCMNSLISIGDGSTTATVENLVVVGVRGRNGISQVFNKQTDGDDIPNANDITDATVGECGLISVQSGSTLDGAIIITGQEKNTGIFDVSTDSAYIVPYVLLSAHSQAIVKNVRIETSIEETGDVGEWMPKVVNSLSTAKNACNITVQTPTTTGVYDKSLGIVSISEQGKVDLSPYAKDIEVVKSVNDIPPDENGNVTIEFTEEEPIVVGSLEECTDTSKKYVLPDGYIYRYTREFIKGGTFANFTNQVPLALNSTLDGVYNDIGYKMGVYTNGANEYESAASSSAAVGCTGFIPLKVGDTLRVNSLGWNKGSGANIFVYLDANRNKGYGTKYAEMADRWTANGGTFTDGAKDYNGDFVMSDFELTVPSGLIPDWMGMGDLCYVRINFHHLYGVSEWNPKDLIVTVNEEISYTVIEDHYEYGWKSTGELYVKPDYLGMIKVLEERVAQLENALSNPNN